MDVALDNRKISILFAVIDEYVRTAEPVASQAIVDARTVDASSATIRNEMATLEAAGYLIQPHTSAGRIPTERGYRCYVDRLQRQQVALATAAAATITDVVRQELDDVHTFGKSIARTLAALASQTIVVGFARGDAYATGISYVVVQPEFQDPEVLRVFSAAIDRLDDTIDALDDLLNGQPQVVLGEGNPFGEQCGTVASHLALPPSFAEASEGREGHTMTLGIVGPMRMAYERNLGLLEAVRGALGTS